MRVSGPVCKIEMEDKWVASKSELKGKTFYFCCESWKKQFDENPDKFA